MTTYDNITPETLNDAVEFDHFFRVHPDGTVTDSPDSPYLEVSMYQGDDGEWYEEFQIPEGWHPVTGYSGQHSYSGPVMHSSEYLGGRMASDVLETPGDYVLKIVESHCNYVDPDSWCSEENGCDCEPEGWVLLHKPLEEA